MGVTGTSAELGSTKEKWEPFIFDNAQDVKCQVKTSQVTFNLDPFCRASPSSAPSGYESPRSPKARLTACQSDIGSSCIAGRQWFTLRRRSRCRLASDIGSQSVTTGPDQAGSTSGSGWFSRHRAAPPNSPGRRSRLSLFCLPLTLWGRKK